MGEYERATINNLPSGVPGLDQILGGGVPEYSFNLIAGMAGAGKTTLAQQIVFANASPGRPALFFTVLGEPTLKLMRYQQQFDFFRPDLMGSAVQLVNLSEEVLQQDLNGILDRIVAEVERVSPGIVVVDSFRTIVSESMAGGSSAAMLESFVQRLALHLTSWEVTSFLIGEYSEREQRNPVFTIADGLLWLSQATDRNSVVRKLQVLKLRGNAPMPGLHTFRITGRGLQVFPRIPKAIQEYQPVRRHRVSLGIAQLDEMMAGGVYEGDAVMVSGPTGTGKTLFGTHFISAGIRDGEKGVIAVFEEHPDAFLQRVRSVNSDFYDLVQRGAVEFIYLRPLDLSVDETLEEIREAVARLDARRVVIDSLSGFQVALAPTFREDFQESLYRLVRSLTASGVTVLLVAEVIAAAGDLRFTTDEVSFITDDLIALRYFEAEGRLRKVLCVVKMRGSRHSSDLREFEITGEGIVLGGKLSQFRGVITGVPQKATDE
ncbi:MAG: ATPase domain-containing protein [Gemmatimonadota bacterium]